MKSRKSTYPAMQKNNFLLLHALLSRWLCCVMALNSLDTLQLFARIVRILPPDHMCASPSFRKVQRNGKKETTVSHSFSNNFQTRNDLVMFLNPFWMWSRRSGKEREWTLGTLKRAGGISCVHHVTNVFAFFIVALLFSLLFSFSCFWFKTL